MNADKVFKIALRYLRKNYINFCFFVERDLVWIIQLCLIKIIQKFQFPYKVFYNYSFEKNEFVDLVILNENGFVEVAAEFKYEPSHKRKDIPESRFPVCSWNEICKDVKRAQELINNKKVKIAYAILIDEGGYWYSKKNKKCFSVGEWINWKNDIWVHIVRISLDEEVKIGDKKSSIKEYFL